MATPTIFMNAFPDLTAVVPAAGKTGLPGLPPNFDVEPDEMEVVRHRRTVQDYGSELQWTGGWTPQD